MLKVAMIADLPEPGEVIDGGVQAVTSYLVGAMEKLPDVEVHIVRLRRNLTEAKCIPLGKSRLYVLPMSRLGTLTGFREDQRTLNDCLASISPHIVHSQGAGHYGILACRSNYPAVITIHGILSEEIRYEASLRKRLRLALQSLLSERLCIRKARHTIMISQYVAGYYGNRLTGQRYLVPNPVDHFFFESLRKDTGTKILFAGRLRELKGVSDLLMAVAKLDRFKDVSVVLAGSLSDHAHVQMLRLLSRTLGIEHRTQFTGPLGIERLRQELSSCSCLVLPSYQETAPMVIQEAMAAGVPVIATAICGIPYQVTHGETGFIYAPGDIKSLSGYLSELLNDYSLRSRFGHKAKEFALQNYLSTAVAERTIDIYREIIASV